MPDAPKPGEPGDAGKSGDDGREPGAAAPAADPPAGGGDPSPEDDIREQLRVEREKRLEAERRAFELERNGRNGRDGSPTADPSAASELEQQVRELNAQIGEVRKLAATDPVAALQLKTLEIMKRGFEETTKRTVAETQLSKLTDEERGYVEKWYWQNGNGEFKTVAGAIKAFRHDYDEHLKAQ